MNINFVKMEYKTLNKRTQFKINYVNLTSKKWTLLVFLLCFSFFNLNAQNVEVRVYGSAGTPANAFTGSGFTSLNGGAITGSVAVSGNTASIPSTVAGFSGVDIVIVDFEASVLSTSQAEAIVDFAKAGGIVIASVEYGHPTVSNTTNYNTFMTELFGAGHGGITKSAPISSGHTPSTFTHPNQGTLLMNDATGSMTSHNSGTYSSFSGVPSENRILAGVSSSGCDGTALDIIYPAFPGSPIQQQVGGVDFDGIVIISGEAIGVLTTRSGGRTLAYNQAYTELFYDFLHDPTAMAARRAWSGNSANVNTNCPAATHCAAGSNAPKF
jgi:hypothetical protein